MGPDAPRQAGSEFRFVQANDTDRQSDTLAAPATRIDWQAGIHAARHKEGVVQQLAEELVARVHAGPTGSNDDY